VSEPAKPLLADPSVALLRDAILDDALATVAQLRRDVQATAAAIQRELDGNAELARLGHQLSDLKVKLAGAEETARTRAVDVYKRAGTAKPLPGCEVVQATVIKYDEEQALDYCISNRVLNALRVHKPSFEKLALVMAPPFVTISKEPQTRLARDLDPYYQPGPSHD